MCKAQWSTTNGNACFSLKMSSHLVNIVVTATVHVQVCTLGLLNMGAWAPATYILANFIPPQNPNPLDIKGIQRCSQKHEYIVWTYSKNSKLFLPCMLYSCLCKHCVLVQLHTTIRVKRWLFAAPGLSGWVKYSRISCRGLGACVQQAFAGAYDSWLNKKTPIMQL